MREEMKCLAEFLVHGEKTPINYDVELAGNPRKGPLLGSRIGTHKENWGLE